MKILFMCVANSARSQLAEGLARSILGSHVEVESAGSHPGKLNPYAVAVMKEINIDISKQYSKSLDALSPEFINDLDYIITLCAEEVCPTVLGSKAKRLHWPFPDPATKETLPEAESLRRFRESRNGIAKKINELRETWG